MDRCLSRCFAICALTALFYVPALPAQEKTCQVDLPVGLIDNKGTLLEGLTEHDLTIRQSKQTLAIESIKYDSSPRRVLLILDTSSRLPPDARKAEAILVQYLLSRARPQDSFALLTARGALRHVRFEEGKEVVLKAIQELAANPKEAVKGENILDTLVKGIEWFGQPQAGDALLIMADHLEELNEESQFTDRHLAGNGPLQGVATDRGPSFEKQSSVKFSAVTRMLGDHQIRVFGLQLGSLKTNQALTSVYRPNDEDLAGITLGSGGYAVLDSVDAYGSYVLTESRLQALQKLVWQLYGSISQFYVVRMHSPSPRSPWKLELAKDLRSNTRALYPQQFDPCFAR